MTGATPSEVTSQSHTFVHHCLCNALNIQAINYCINEHIGKTALINLTPVVKHL